MKTITASEARNKLVSYCHQAQKEPISIERYGQRVAVIIGIDDYAELLSAYKIDQNSTTGKNIEQTDTDK